MASIKKIEDEKIVLREYEKAEKNLKQFKEEENGGKWLEDLRSKMRRSNISEREERKLVGLEEEEKRLKKNVDDWGGECIKICYVVEEKVMNKLHKKKFIFRSFHFVYLFIH